MTDKLTFIGLNEFNPDLISEIARILPDGNSLSRLLAQKKIESTTEDELDSGFLEPWVQWVSIQTSTPSTHHGVKNLGDISNLKQPQLWERLSQDGKTSIIWGAMNAKRGGAENCHIFLPDPWVFDEPAYPDEIRSFVELPRYLAKNYTSLSKLKIAKLVSMFVVSGIRGAGVRNFAKFLWGVAQGLAKFGPRHVVFICCFEFLSAAAFCRQARRLKPDLNYLFLNSIAHVQHHYWNREGGQPPPEILYAYARIEEIIAMIDRELGLFSGGRALLVTNALCQVNTSEEPPWVLYRVRDMTAFLKRLGVNFARVETLMTYDGHILFDNREAMAAAQGILADVGVNGARLFFLEPDRELPKLFFRIEFSEPVDRETQISTRNQNLQFDEELTKIVVRTGKHNQKSVVYHNCTDLEAVGNSVIFNHDLFKYIYPELFADNPISPTGAG